MENYKYRSDLGRPELILPAKRPHQKNFSLPQVVCFELPNGTIAEYSLERALELGILAQGIVRRNSMTIGGYLKIKKHPDHF